MQPEQLPADILRDLIGLTRALYRARLTAGAAADALDVIARAGKALRQALEFSLLEVDTIGHRAGWEWADRGVALLAEVLTDGDITASELLRATGASLKKR